MTNQYPVYKIYLIFLFFLLSIYSYLPSAAQCSSEGAFSGSIFSDDNSVGVYSFNTPSNAAVSDNNRTVAASLIGLLSGTTHYLKATSFGFTIPAAANICGIEVQVEKSASNISLLATVTDNVVRLMKAGTIVGNDYSTSSNWSTTESYFTYGGPSDLWGTTWSPSDINAAGFGLAFSAQLHGLISLLPIARIDHIQIIVYYIVPVPIHFISFEAVVQKNNNVLIQWTTEDNDENVTFEIQRSSDANSWSTLHASPGRINIGLQHYSFLDTSLVNTRAYYRVKMTLPSGKVLFTKVISVLKPDLPALKLFPNPSHDFIILSSSGAVPVINLLTTNGCPLPVQWERISPTQIKISTAKLKGGNYIIRLDGHSAAFVVE